MSIISMWISQAEEKNKTLKNILTILWYAILVLALFLAVKDMGMLTHGMTKVGVILLAAMFPELYVILHLISTSSMGVGFFSGSPIESKMSTSWFKPSGGASSWLGGSKAAKAAKAAAPSPDMDMGTPTETTDSSSLF